MKEAFTYMFKDNKFLQKFIVYSSFLFLFFLSSQYIANLFKLSTEKPIFNVFGLYFLLFIIAVFSCLTIIGYNIKIIKSLSIQKENYILPFLNIWSCLKSGFKLSIAFLIAGFILGILYFISFVPTFNIVFLLVSILILLSFLFYTTAYYWIFAQTESFLSFLKIITASKIISFAKSHYFLYFFICLIITIIDNLFTQSFIIVFYKNIFLMSFITTYIGVLILSYLYFVKNYLIAKSIKPECIKLLK